MAFSYLNSTVSSLFASLDDADNSVIKIGDHELAPTTVPISKLSIDMLTPELLKAFSFNNSWTVQPPHEYRASSIVVFTSIARLNQDGLLTECSFSAWGARQRRVDNKFPLNKPEQTPVVKSDIFLQADYYSLGIGDMVLPVPVYQVEAYKGGDDKRVPLSIRLSSVSAKADNVEAEYDRVRSEYNDVVRAAAVANGIPFDEQFEVCVVGFPTKTAMVSQKDKESFYGVQLHMGYMVGVRVIKGSVRVQNQHSINLNHMVGGESLQDKLLKEIASLSTGAVTPTIVKATAPVVVVTAPTPVIAVAPVDDVELDEDGMEIKTMPKSSRNRPATIIASVPEPVAVVTPVAAAEPVVAPAKITKSSVLAGMMKKAAPKAVVFEAE